MSEMKRAHGLVKLRVRGLARVHFAVVCKVIACNIKRWAKAASASPRGRLRLLSLVFRLTNELCAVWAPMNGRRWSIAELKAA